MRLLRLPPLWHFTSVTTTEAIRLLENFRAGGVNRDQVLRAFQAAPVANLGFAQVDTHRALRKGFPEVIFGSGKTPAQVVKIAAQLVTHEQRVLVTRITAEHARAMRKKFRNAVHHETARCVTIEKKALPKRAGSIAVICAGTSDLPVAEEAAVTAEIITSVRSTASIRSPFGKSSTKGVTANRRPSATSSLTAE